MGSQNIEVRYWDLILSQKRQCGFEHVLFFLIPAKNEVKRIADSSSAQILDDLPSGEIRVKAPPKIPVGEAVSRYEAPRGELIYYLKSNGSNMPERVKIRSPTLGNWLVMVQMLRGVKNCRCANCCRCN
jgi:NADH:ubiquinone oxidoreductase subunit D